MVGIASSEMVVKVSGRQRDLDVKISAHGTISILVTGYFWSIPDVHRVLISYTHA
jgi:hypothetical protein